MTYDELKVIAQAMGGYVKEDIIYFGAFEFYRNGNVDCDGACIADNRTPEQMLFIMVGVE